MLEVGYVGNHGVHLQRLQRLQRSRAGPRRHSGAPALPALGHHHLQHPGRLHQLQLAAGQIRTSCKPRSHALVAYTYSKFLQFNQSPALGGNLGYEYALSPYDTPHNVALSETLRAPLRPRPHTSSATPIASSIALLAAGSCSPSSSFAAERRIRPCLRRPRQHRCRRPAAQLNPAASQLPTSSAPSRKWFDKRPLHRQPALHLRPGPRQHPAQRHLPPVRRLASSRTSLLPGESTLSFRAEFFNLSNTTSFNAPNPPSTPIRRRTDHQHVGPLARYPVRAQVQLLTHRERTIAEVFSCCIAPSQRASASVRAGCRWRRARCLHRRASTRPRSRFRSISPRRSVPTSRSIAGSATTRQLHAPCARPRAAEGTARSQPRARLHPRASSAHLRQRRGGAEIQLHQRLHAKMRAASPSTTSRSSTTSSTRTKPPACARWSSSASCPRISPPTCPIATSPTRSTTRRAPSPASSNNPAEGLREVGRARPRRHRASGRALRQRRSAAVVLRGLERAGHRLLARHAGGLLQALRLRRCRCARRAARSTRRRARHHQPRLAQGRRLPQ